MQKLLMWIVVLAGTYFLGFYMGLQRRSNEDPDITIKKHLEEIRQKAQDKGEKIWKTINE